LRESGKREESFAKSGEFIDIMKHSQEKENSKKSLVN
jgi:hypothetical protein